MKIKKITIEYEDMEPYELVLKETDSFSVTINRGLKYSGDKFGNLIKEHNGIEVLKIIVAPKFILNEIDPILEGMIKSLID